MKSFYAVELYTTKNSTAIRITWPEVENDVMIIWNKALANQCTENDTDIENFAHGQTPYIITGLKEFTEYNITVCINGSVCAYKSVMTDEAGICLLQYKIGFHFHFNSLAPTAPPEAISFEDSSPTSITISWDPVPCGHRNGNITSYVVMFRENGSNMFHNRTSTGIKLRFEITGLEPSTQYELKVAGVTVAAGPFTKEGLAASTLGM